MSKPILAIMYDFDKTLSTTDMQNYTFIPNLGMTPEEFWGATGEFTNNEGVERILSYMYMMIKQAREKGIKLTREYLRECGKTSNFILASPLGSNVLMNTARARECKLNTT